MKVKKLLLSVILIFVAVILGFNTKTYAATGSWKLGVVQVREGGNAYRIDQTQVLKIVDKERGTPNFDKAIYCVKAGAGFGSADYTMSDVTYNLYYDMVKEKAQVNGILKLSDSNYGSILWLLDHMYYPKIEGSSRLDYLQKIFQPEFDKSAASDTNIWAGIDASYLYLTDDDIEVVQQWALWHFTNPSDAKFQGDLATIQVSTTGNTGSFSGWDTSTSAGIRHQKEAEYLYNYLITEATANSNYSKQPTEVNLNKTLTPTVKQKSLGTANYMVVGPFEVQLKGEAPDSFEAKVTDKAGNTIKATVCDANGNDHATIRALNEVPGKGQFYIKLEKASLLNGNISDIKLQISYTTNDTTATFWTVNGSTVDQPVVVVDKTPKTIEDEIEVHIPKFDLALRKYIVGVTRNGEAQTIAELTGRIPNIDKANLMTVANGKTNTTAEYKHRKDPVPVQTGDIVQYKITIYNEGEVIGRATKIVDYLPVGLEFASGVSTNYTFTTEGRKIIITQKNSNNLAAYNGTTLDSVDIIFNCKVTKKEDKEISGDTILTNIAEITESYDVNGTKMYQVGDDRDSEPDNLRLPGDANLPSYKGNNSNKSELNDKDYHYKGQQDDDDFEKLKVTTPEFDLALRKFITHVNGTEVTPKREPVVDTTPLKNGEETALYKHIKEPVTVRVGGTITYTIRIYNEADVDGYVTIIEDYLPEELELVEYTEGDGSINDTYKWQGSGRLVTTNYLNGQTIKAFDGGDTLDYKDVQIECKLKDTAVDGKVLTNIAQINGDSGDDRDSTPGNRPIIPDEDLPNYKGNEENKPELDDEDYYYKGNEDDDDFEKVIVYKPGFDLSLRKFITHINGEEVEVSREPVVDTTPLKDGQETAIYKHPKNPLTIKIGEVVRYTIRVYNEADADGYVTVIEDYLPEELELVPQDESEINRKYNWQGSGRVVTTSYLDGTTLKAFDGGDTLDYKDVEIECRLKDTENVGKVLTNIAQINGDSGDDRDSTPGNVNKPTDTNLPDYKGDEENKSELGDKDYYYKGQEDDDDFEKVKIYQPEYDLALRKFITKVEDEEITSRIPVVDVSPLIDDSEDTTTAIYTHPKDPVLVRNGNVVVYTIRVYNEGKFDAYAELVKDNIPDGLEFIVTNEINAEYRWRLSEDGKQVSTDYLSKKEGEDKERDNLIKAFDPETMETLDYRDVKIAFKVTEPNTSTRIITNIAEIKDDNGNDIDSTPDNDTPGEDDIDEEHIKLRYFDLALRKFITKVENKNGENLPVETDDTTDVSREPKVEIDEDGKIKYVHPKDPVIVANSDIVIYTLRVYNEGTIDGYAEEIKDDVPVGLELVPEHEINQKYGWVMYDEDGEVTNDVKKAKTIRTTYLSEENSEDNIIKAFDRETMNTPAYKDVQVAFKVVEKNVGEERIVINTAEISKDSDDDEDSTPDNDVEDEDDIDKEYIKLKYFDLSLLKWVSKMMVTKNGETTVTETGFNGLEDPEPVVKYEIKQSELKTIGIKYEYTIKITNEGEIEGYAKEITDYIPEGLQFVAEDNPLWTLGEDGKITTRQLENTLLQPGESATVTVIFRWINNENNLGQKRNVAEISEDYNEKDAEDIDSTPDNSIWGEDDIDDAYVILSPKTGKMAMYIALPIIVLTVLASGIVLIKKYVM